jgi:hypothetical protein
MNDRQDDVSGRRSADSRRQRYAEIPHDVNWLALFELRQAAALQRQEKRAQPTAINQAVARRSEMRQGAAGFKSSRAA